MKPFDFNNDGKVDPVEKGLEYHIYQEVEKELNDENSNSYQSSRRTSSVTTGKLSGRKILGLILLVFAAILEWTDAGAAPTVIFGIIGILFLIR